MIPLVGLTDVQSYDRALTKSDRVSQVIDDVGFRVASFIRSTLGPIYAKRILAIVGKGNNGADATAAARYLRQFGGVVDEVLFNWDDAPYSGEGYDLIIDGAFGTGISRPLQCKIIEALGAKVVSIDLPSGVDIQRLDQDERSVKADITLVIGSIKEGQLSRGVIERMGETYLWRFDDLGSPNAKSLLFEPFDLHFRDEALDEHKWNRAVHVVAGSKTTIGAGVLAGVASIRAGAGLVRVSGDFDRPDLIQASHPDLIVGDEESFERDLSNIDRYRVVVVGPGLGDRSEHLLELILKNYGGPLVIDADGINGVGRSKVLQSLLKGYGHPVLLTPHSGEASRLFGAMGLDLSETSIGIFAADFGVDLLLKGFPTRIFSRDNQTIYVTSNRPNLSVAGSGDVLSGVVGAFIARNGYSIETVASATYIHGLSGGRGLTNPLSMIDSLPHLIDSIPNMRSKRLKLPGYFRPIVSNGPFVGEEDSILSWRHKW